MYIFPCFGCSREKIYIKNCQELCFKNKCGHYNAIFLKYLRFSEIFSTVNEGWIKLPLYRSDVCMKVCIIQEEESKPYPFACEACDII